MGNYFNKTKQTTFDRDYETDVLTSVYDIMPNYNTKEKQQLMKQETKIDSFPQINELGLLSPHSNKNINLRLIPIENNNVQEQKNKFSFENSPYCKKSFDYFHLNNKFRLICIEINESKLFQYFMILYTIAILVILIFQDYNNKENGLGFQINETQTNNIFIATDIIFALHHLISLISYGVWDTKYGYYKNPFSTINGLCLILAIIFRLEYLYCFRVLFILEYMLEIPYFKTLKRLNQTYVSSFPFLAFILGIMIFIITIYSIIGVQLWSGVQNSLCINLINNEIDTYPVRYCGFGRQCEEGFKCEKRYSEEPFVQISHNFTKFDYFQDALATMFVVHNIEGWVEIYQNLSDSVNDYVSLIHLWSYIIIGSFFIQNLIVAVILKQYQATQISEDSSLPFIFLNTNTRIQIHKKQHEILSGTPTYLLKSKRRVLKLLSYSEIQREPNRLQIFLKELISFKITTIFINLLFLSNLIILSLNNENSYDNNFEEIIGKINLIYLILYLIEDLIRIYIQKKSNNNFVLFIEFSLDLICLIYQIKTPTQPFVLNAYKGIRLLWFFNEQTNWSHYKVLLSALWKSFCNVYLIFVALLLFLIVFIILGRALYAGQIYFDEDGAYNKYGKYTPRINFNSLRETTTAFFILLSSDQWQTMLFTTLEGDSYTPYPFFIFSIFVFRFLLLPMFLALMLNNYEEAKQEAEIAKARATKVISSLQRTKIVPINLQQSSSQLNDQKKYFGRMSKISDDSEIEEVQIKLPLKFKRQQSTFFVRNIDSNEILISNQTERISTKEKLKNSSLFILYNKTKLRKKIIILISSKYFDWFMTIIIIINFLLAIIDIPLREPNNFIDIMNKLLISIFILEICLKILANGFIWNNVEPNKAYVYNIINITDMFITILTSINDFNIYQSGYIKAFTALRMIRVLQTFKKISQIESLDLISRSLTQTISLLSSLIFITILSLWILGIFCMSMWKGKLYYCSGISFLSFLNINDKNDCLQNGGQWINNVTNFDTIQNSLLCLFRLIIGEGWAEEMFSVSDITGRSLNPKIDYSANYQLIYYFLIFILNVMLFNLFTGLIINNYRTIKENIKNFHSLNEKQIEWIQMMYIMQQRTLHITKNKPQQPFRIFFYNIVNKKYFEIIVFLLLLTNLVFCATYSKNEDNQTTIAISVFNIIFISIFHIELFMKIIAFQTQYFKEFVNQFDFTLLILGHIFLVLQDYTGLDKLYIIPLIFRSLRIFITFQNLKINRYLTILMDVIQNILPIFLGFIIFTMGLIIAFSIIGIQTLSTVQSTEIDNSYPFMFEESYRNLSFQSFGDIIIILLQITTGQFWTIYMQDYTLDKQNCHQQTYQESLEEGIRGCGTVFGYFYFITFLVLIKIIMMSLFLAIIIEIYSDCLMENTAAISPYQLEDFLLKWSEYDLQGSGWISVEDFAFLMFELNPPLGFKDDNAQYFDFSSKLSKQKSHLYNHKKKMILYKTEIFAKLSDYQVQVYENQCIHFKDVCLQLAYNAVKKKYDLQGIEQIEDLDVLRQIRRSWESKYPDLKGQKPIQFVVDVFAISSIKDILKGVIERRKIKQRIRQRQKENNLRLLEINEKAYLTYQNLNERFKHRKRSLTKKKLLQYTQSFRRKAPMSQGDLILESRLSRRATSKQNPTIIEPENNKTALQAINFYFDSTELTNGFPMKVSFETQKIEMPQKQVEKVKQLANLQKMYSTKVDGSDQQSLDEKNHPEHLEKSFNSVQSK